ncbi:MAG TPA: hypothetical protein VIT87_06880, partial [Gemmatimonadales bacterium]
LLAGSIACATTEAPIPPASTVRLGELWNAEVVPGALVHRTPQGVVTIMFNYPQSADFSAVVAAYSERLGPPFQHEKPSDPEAAERVVSHLP